MLINAHKITRNPNIRIAYLIIYTTYVVKPTAVYLNVAKAKRTFASAANAKRFFFVPALKTAALCLGSPGENAFCLGNVGIRANLKTMFRPF